MIAADRPVQRPPDARLLVVDADGRMTHAPRSRFVDFLATGRSGDRQRCGDAARQPARRAPAERRPSIEVAARRPRPRWRPTTSSAFTAVVFGAGDFRTRTEDRPLPPRWRLAIVSRFGPLSATVEALLDHPRLVPLRFERLASTRVGRPRAARPADSVRAHAGAARLVGRVDADRRRAGCLRAAVGELRAGLGDRSARCATAASRSRRSRSRQASRRPAIPSSISRLPFDEPYRIPEATASAIRQRARPAGGSSRSARRSCARSSTPPRATVSCAQATASRTSASGPSSRLRIVDAILSGTHEPDSSHYQLLRAFVDERRWPGERSARGARLPDARIRRFGADREVACQERAASPGGRCLTPRGRVGPCLNLTRPTRPT